MKIAIFISGRGSNMEAILNAFSEPDSPVETVLVLSDQTEAKGLKTAQSRGIATIAISRDNHESRDDHEAAIIEAVEQSGAELICLAGFMRLLSASFVARFADRITNIHPSLLPRHKGLDTHNRALNAGDEWHGCTVHLVNAEMDGGAVIAQAKVPILPGDDEESLAARVLEQEHKLYPAVVAMIARGELAIKDGKVIPRRDTGPET